MNTIDLSVESALAAFGISYNAALIGETVKNEWICDQWRVKFDKFETFYYTGAGLRTKPKQSWVALKPVRPTAASVLYSLLMDSEAINESFKNWCDNYGYDDDSITAFNTYRECCAIGQQLYKVFNREQVEQLRTLLEGY